MWFMRALIFASMVVLATHAHAAEKAPGNPPPGMAWIPGGEFAMGSELPGSRLNEKPVLKVNVDGVWLDEHDVTNAEFRKFVEATGYKTTAERPVNWEELKKQVAPGTPKPPDEVKIPIQQVQHRQQRNLRFLLW